ncbi:MAG: biotin/lipoate A/B protein ligase family protein [Planctomycetota bacterium]
MKWRLFIEERGAPAWNMAVDEAILTCFDPASDMPTLRMYGWSPAAVSIGYFQPARSAGSRDYPLFRRITGGGAICHDGDFTYSVVVGRVHPIAKPSLYNAIHEAMSNALHQMNVDAKPRWVTKREDMPINLNGEAAGNARQIRESAPPFLCSGREAEADLLVGGKKILGSAQRRSRQAVLQHGSMPIKDLTYDGRMTSVCREAKREVEFGDVAAAVRISFESVFGVTFEEGRLSEEERDLADGLAKEKYGEAKWNYRR